jgi:GNAT superfamily N-acetyltransferase
MDIQLIRSADDVDFAEAAVLLERTNLAAFDADVRHRAFTNSDVVMFLYDNDAPADGARKGDTAGLGKLIGCGRALTDWAYEAALYDVAVDPDYQGHGLGRMIVDDIFEQLKDMNVIFFASLPAQEFYEHMGCLPMKTGMAHWRNPQRMLERGYS